MFFFVYIKYEMNTGRNIKS